MRRTLARACAALLVAILLGSTLAACGRYGPPTPYPPGQEPDRHRHHDDEDDQG